VTQQRKFARNVPALHRNVWVASATSFLTDVSSEMVVNVLPLYLSGVLGVRTSVIGLIEGVAASLASLLQLASGALSDRIGRRKWPAVAGYGISSLAKPFLALASSWPGIAAARWADRVGKGLRTAPRDALVADSTADGRRGLAFGLHRAADTGGAVLGLLLALAVLSHVDGGGNGGIRASSFRALVWVSLVPAFAAVAILAVGAREVRGRSREGPARLRLRGLGRNFGVFLLVSLVFDLGNSSDAFLMLRAQERGLQLGDILWALVGFNLVYALVATPAGRLSDRVGRKRMLVVGWALYIAVYAGFARARQGSDVATLFLLYGGYYGLTAGAAKALIADLVPVRLRATAYGTYNASLALIDLPASLLAGVLWQGVGSWSGFGPGAPFAFGAAAAALAVVLLLLFVPEPRSGGEREAARSV